MFAFIITIHIATCALLILIVLVQQGKGGGLIDSLSSAESIFGTKTNTFLVKSTSVLAVIFFITCLSLAFLSIQKSKSLIQTSYKPNIEKNQNIPLPTTSTAIPTENTYPVQQVNDLEIPAVTQVTDTQIPPIVQTASPVETEQATTN